MSVTCTLMCVRRNLMFIILALILIIVGVIFLAYGAANYEEKSTEKKIEEERYGVVIDAGGSGTRLVIYKYSPRTNTMKDVNFKKCEDNGLGTYKVSEFPELRKTMKKCLDDADRMIPIQKDVPIFLGATAGMRLLKLRAQPVFDQIWTMLNDTLKESNFKVMMSQTITGTQEAQWAWLAANYIKKTLKASDSNFGIIDFGSSSIQLAFTPSGDKSKLDTFNINGENMTIYGHSYLCYGKREMERRLLAKLVTDASFNSTVQNPCFFPGYEKNYSSSFLWASPCSSGAYAKDKLGSEYLGPADKNRTYTLQGTGNSTQCLNVIQSLIKTTCSSGDCGMNDVFQPKVEGKFLALTVFGYAADFMGISSTASRQVLKNATEKTCATNWKEISSRDIPGTPVKYRGSRCFDAWYSYFLLTDGFKFDDASWKLEYVNEVNGQKLQWSLGLMYMKKDNMFKNIRSYILQKITRKQGMLGLAVFGAVLLVIGIIILIVAIICRRKKGHLPVSGEE